MPRSVHERVLLPPPPQELYESYLDPTRRPRIIGTEHSNSWQDRR